MAISYDFEHAEEIANAILSRIETNLGSMAAAWVDKLNPLLGLKRIEFGDFYTWRFSGEEGDAEEGDLIPSILLRFSETAEQPDLHSIGGNWGRATPFTLVHLFGEEQVRDLASPGKAIQVDRAKAQRAKLVSKALYYSATDADKLRFGLGTASSLTSEDTDAHVLTTVPGPTLYRGLPEDVPEVGRHAIGIQLTVLTLTD